MTQWTLANSFRSLEMETIDVATIAASKHEKKKPIKTLSRVNYQPQRWTPQAARVGGHVLPRDNEVPARLRDPVASGGLRYAGLREGAPGVVAEDIARGGISLPEVVAPTRPAHAGHGTRTHRCRWSWWSREKYGS